MKYKNITFQFDNEKVAEHFAIWMCESGEQQYWQWMEIQEERDESDITATEFHYHTDNGSKEWDDMTPEEQEEYNERGDDPNTFLADGIIRTTCGRLNTRR